MTDEAQDRAAAERDDAAAKRDQEAGRRDLQEAVNDALHQGADGEDDRERAAGVRRHSLDDRLASGEDRRHAAEDRSAAREAGEHDEPGEVVDLDERRGGSQTG